MGIIRRSLDYIGIPPSWKALFPDKPDGSSAAVQHFLSLMPFLFSVIVLFFSVYYDSICQAVSQRRISGHYPPLPDVGHQLLPWIIITNSKGAQNVHNIFLYVFGAATGIRFIFTGRLFIVLLRRFFFMWGILFIFRGTAIAITNYPYTDGTYYPLCQTYLSPNTSVWIQGWYVMFGYNTTCNDFMFSGHTTACTLLALQWTTYAKNDFASWINLQRAPRWVQYILRPRLDATGDADGPWLISVLMGCVVGAMIIVLVGGRIHYSDDCIVGMVITYSWYKMYFYYLKTVYERDTWMSKFMIWFEGLSLPDVVIREGMTVSDLYVYQPSTKKQAIYNNSKPEMLPNANDLQMAHQQALDPNYNANIVLITIPNELNPYHPLEYFYTNMRRDIAVNTSGSPTNWGWQKQ